MLSITDTHTLRVVRLFTLSLLALLLGCQAVPLEPKFVPPIIIINVEPVPDMCNPPKGEAQEPEVRAHGQAYNSSATGCI